MGKPRLICIPFDDNRSRAARAEQSARAVIHSRTAVPVDAHTPPERLNRKERRRLHKQGTIG